jgi:hypothetical protein
VNEERRRDATAKGAPQGLRLPGLPQRAAQRRTPAPSPASLKVRHRRRAHPSAVLALFAVAAALGVLDVAAIALGAGDDQADQITAGEFDRPTGSTIIDLFIELAPAINLVVLGVLGRALGQQRREVQAARRDVRKLHRSPIRVVTDRHGTPRAIELVEGGPDEHGAEAYDAEGRAWARVERQPGGRRHYDDYEEA